MKSQAGIRAKINTIPSYGISIRIFCYLLNVIYGIPIAFDIFDGASNEQPSLKPLEKKLIKDFDFDKFVVCTDAGLGSDANRKFNSINDRSFVVTQSLKKLKDEERISAMDAKNWRRLSDGKPVKTLMR